MKNEYKNILKSTWLRSILFLAIIYFSQIYPYYHLHHIHDKDFFEFEVSSHPIEIEIEHSSDHNHDGDSQHTDNHQHTFKKHIDWLLLRTQNHNSVSLDNQFPFPSISFIKPDDKSNSYLSLIKYLYIDDPYPPTFIIRGPPLFV